MGLGSGRACLWAEEDANTQDEGWNERRTQLESPRNITSVFDDDIGAEAQENANNNPQLPEHDKRAADAGRRHLSAVNGDRSILRANTNSHDEAGGEETLP